MVKFLNRFFAESPKEQIVKTIKVETIGTTGTENYAGYTAEEYLSTLKNSRQRADKYDQMRRSDAQVNMCLSSVMFPLLSAIYEIHPYDQNDGEAKKDADLIKWILFHGMDKSWSDFLTEAYSFIAFGHSVFERLDKVVLSHPEFGNVNALKNLVFISQRTIERWNIDRKTFDLKSVTQIANGDLYSYTDIPAEFLLCFSLKKEGSNFEGVSALRPIFGNWFRKNIYLKLNAIGVEKFAIPTPLVTIPDGKEGSTQFDNMISALEAYCAHEKAYLTKPAGWEIDLKTNTYDPMKVEASIDNEDKRMVKSFLANFLELGMNGFGSQSLSFDLSDFFLGSIEYVAKILCDEINRKLIPTLVKMNKGERRGYPQLKVSGISDKVGIELSQILQNLSGAKVIIPDDVLEDNVRKRYNLPERSEEGKRESKQPQFDNKEIANKELHNRLKQIYG